LRRNDIELGIDSPSAIARASCVDVSGTASGGVAGVRAGVAAGRKFVEIAMASTLSCPPMDQAPMNPSLPATRSVPQEDISCRRHRSEI
jgi:membrane protease subunit (stomatin/prohibitin family)